MRRILASSFAVALLLTAIACSTQRAQTPSFKETIERSLDQAGLKDVKVNEDKDKNLITLNGKVQSQDQAAAAEQIAKAQAPGRVIANQISIEPAGVEGQARSIESNLDTGIEKDFKAVLIAHRLDNKGISYHAKNGVLTLTGNVKTMAMRDQAEQLAATVPNVSQVVNEIQVKKRG